MSDIRTLCPRCRGDYLDAGYRLRLIPGRYRQPCDLCGRPGMEFELIEQKCKTSTKPQSGSTCET